MRYVANLLSLVVAGLFFLPVAQAQLVAVDAAEAVAETEPNDMHRAFRDSRQQPPSAKLQVAGPLRDDVYRVEYTFQADAGETVVIYWEGISSDVIVSDVRPAEATPSYYSEGQAYSLPNIELGEQADNHRMFWLEAAGEYQLSVLVTSADTPASIENPNYFIRVRSASEVERLSAQAAGLIAGYQSSDNPDLSPLLSTASLLLDMVIEREPDLPQPYLQRVHTWVLLLLEQVSFDTDSVLEEILVVFQTLPEPDQAAIVSDLRRAGENYTAIATVEEGFFSGKGNPELLMETANFLESGILSPYMKALETEFLNNWYHSLMF